MRAILALFLINSFLFVSAQKVNLDYIDKIDTLFCFIPFGYVTTFYDNVQKTSPEYTESEKDSILKMLNADYPGVIIFYKDSLISEDYKAQENIIQILETVDNLDKNIFTIVPTGKILDSLVVNYPGRFFGFVYFSGFKNNKIKHTWITSVGLMVLTSVLTAGLFTMYLVPLPSVMQINFLIIDKEQKKFVYYSNKRVSRTFSMYLNNEKLIRKVLKKYKKNSLNINHD